MDDALGTPEQRALLARGAAMRAVTRDDPGLTYYGRTVGLAAPEPDGIARLAALARLQGNASVAAVPGARVAALSGAGAAEGFAVAHYDRWTGADEAMARAERLLREIRLPDDLTVEALTAETPSRTRAAFGALASGAGVLPPAMAVMTGRDQPGLCLIARDGAGRVVSCAAAAAYLHPDHPDGRTECWWGMLATEPARRGAGLSLALGARAMLAMRDRHGFGRVMTGVAPGNAPSEAVCTRLKLARSGEAIVGLADPVLLPGGRMTR